MDYDKINAGIREKTKGFLVRLKSRIKELDIKHVQSDTNQTPLSRITNKFSLDSGMINRIRFNFKKSGIYVHKGVGRGTKASQVGQTNRKPKEWFNPELEAFANELIEEIADETVELAFEKLRIK